MTKKCLECKSNNFSIDVRMGELVCDDCGLVLVTEPFEQSSYSFNANGERIRESWKTPNTTVSMRSWGKTDKAIHTGIAMCKILLSSLSESKVLRERIESLYRTLYHKHVFTSSTLEDRSAALVYFLLREQNLPYSLKEVCREYDCVEKRVFKLSKKIANHQGKTSIFLIRDSRPFAEKHAHKFGDSQFVSKVGRLAYHYDELVSKTGDNLRPSSSVVFCYIVSIAENMAVTQREIAEKTGISTKTIQKETRRLLKIKNINKKQIEGKGIEWIETY